ncbi:MAG: ABC transporter permease [Candidatus Omnitrophica bacterium]|nr:ABC transporter permease [Candidatus Omnitrophota bacterium]
MIKFIMRRLFGLVPMLFGITLISFMVIKLAPGKPVMLQYSLNPKISLEEIKRLEKIEGFDKPLYAQYLNWLSNISRFNFGRSIADGRFVTQKIAERLPVTLTINILSLFLIFLIALPWGIRSALRQGSLFDKISTLVTFLLFAAPTFWLALLLMQLFCIQLGWLPISGITSLDFEHLNLWQKFLDLGRHLFLPVLVSALAGFAGICRYMRSNMIEALRQPYIYTARAKGLPENRIIYKHALRNALLPIITILGLSLPGLLGGSIIFESIFAIPGIGRLFYEAAMMRDMNLIMAEIVLVAVLTMLGNLIADVLYAYVDPRIRYKK